MLIQSNFAEASVSVEDEIIQSHLQTIEDADRRALICEQTKILAKDRPTGKGWNTNCYANIIKSLGKVPAERLETVVESTLKITKGQVWHNNYVYDFAKLIDTLGNVPLAHSEEFVKTALNFVNAAKKVFEKIKVPVTSIQRLTVNIVSMLAKVPADRFEEIVEIPKQGRWRTADYCEVIQGFSQAPFISPESVVNASFVNAALRIIKAGRRTGKACRYVIDSLLCVPTDRLESVANAALGIKKKCTDSRPYMVIRTLAKLPPDHLKSVVKSTLMIAKVTKWKEWDGANLRDLIEALSKVPADHLTQFVEKALMIADGKVWDKRSLINLITGLAKVPANRFEEFVETTLKITQGSNWPADYYSRFINSLAQVPTDRLESVATKVMIIKGSDPASLINALRKLPADRFEKIVKAALKIAKGRNSEGFSYARIIKPLVKVPDESLESVANATLRISEGKEWEDFELKNLIKILRKVPFTRFEGIVETAVEITQGEEWTSAENRRLIGCLEELPVDRMELSKLLRPLTKYPAQCLHILATLPFLPEDQQEKFLDEAGNLAAKSPQTFKYDYDEPEQILVNHALAMGEVGDDSRTQLFAHWEGLLKDENKWRAPLSRCIKNNYSLELGLTENDPIVQLARRKK